MRNIFIISLLGLFISSLFQVAVGAEGIPTERMLAKALVQKGNHKEAFEIYQKLVVDPANTGLEAGQDVSEVINCLYYLERSDQWDALAEKIVGSHAADWQVLRHVARGYFNFEHEGYIIDGEFKRGYHRQGGRWANVVERDRIRALQLMLQAQAALRDGDDAKQVGAFYLEFAHYLRGHYSSSLLQVLTDIKTLPDHDAPRSYGRNAYAPVDENNKPIYFYLPQSWNEAKNDGERWRWLLHRASVVDPDSKKQCDLMWAEFLHQQFGVQTLGSLREYDADGKPKSGIYAVHTLQDDEVLAQLATGIQRFPAVDEFNFIKIYRNIAGNGPREQASPISDLTYKYYEGDWDSLPDFSTLKPTKSGTLAKGFCDITVAQRKNYFGIIFEGMLSVPEDGNYTFVLDSDDGSLLTIGKEEIIKHDGLHGLGNEKSATITLKKGLTPIAVSMFEKTGDQALKLLWSGPGFGAVSLTTNTYITPEEEAQNHIASIYENRLQRDRAAQEWKKSIEWFGAGENNWKQERLSQLVDNWCRLENTGMHIAGKPVSLGFSFRNASEVNLTAHKVNITQFIADIKTYLKSDPNDFDSDQVDFDYIGHRLVYKDEAKYLGEQAATWDQIITPADDHWDRRIELAAPLKEAGLYLVKATVANGNTSRILVWITDTVIVDKRIHNNHLYFIADAVTGAPIPGANLEFFGYDQYYNRTEKKYHIKTVNFAEKGDEQGIVVPDASLAPSDHSYLITAKTDQGRFAVYGFASMYVRPYRDTSRQQTAAYIVSDRPVYRPGQKVHLHAWVRQARYDLDDISSYAGHNFFMSISDPTGKTILEKEFKADTFGNFQNRIDLGDDALLGSYRVWVYAKNFVHPETGKKRNKYTLGRLNFRVEEYKKPEFEVTVEAPTEPTTLGDTIKATVKATYYFGAPVQNAQVKYTVNRSEHFDNWIPPRRWDWFYGEGYWWFSDSYEWYPNWKRWGCFGPGRWHNDGPSEIVQENTVAIGADGTVTIEIDTAVAKAFHGDSDHKYTIDVEVVDESRRTITGSGSVIAARHPFSVFSWTERGHHTVGDDIVANFQARSPDGKPVSGKGKAVLNAITYDDSNKPIENEVQTWALDTNDQGLATLTLKAHKAGQYRLSYTLTSKAGHQREGAVIIVVRGEGAAGDNFRFNDLEIIPDKMEYAVGDRVQLMVNTAHKGSTVLLFVRPVNGVVTKPQVLRLDDKTMMKELEVTTADLPNFHVEAVTIINGRVFTQTRNIVVPPEKRILQVDIKPSANTFKPGTPGKVKIKLTDSNGKPFKAQAVVSIFDKSVEYIASDRPENIKAFFWKWQRSHSAYDENNMQRWFNELLKKDEKSMYPIGVYGGEDYEGADLFRGAGGGGRGGFSLFAQDESYAMDAANSMPNAPGSAVLGELKKEMSDGKADRVLAKAKNAAQAFSGGQKGGGGGAGGGPLVEASVRKEFADTAFWTTDIVTDENGEAEVELTMPENLTTWKVQVWALGHGTVVGEGSAEVITSKDLLIRLQAPRFFVEKDKVLLSANVHNYLDGKRNVKVSLELEGDNLLVMDSNKQAQTIALGAKEDRRVDWWVTVAKEGTATIRMKAQTTDDADAMQMEFPVYVHGALRTESWSGVVKPSDTKAEITMTVPEERRPDQSLLEIRYSPSIALAMVDALPYLATYHHKNCESTLHRFMPAVVTQKLLQDMQINLDEVRKKINNLNPQEIGEEKKRAQQWDKYKQNPIFDNDQIVKLVKQGLADLAGMQNGDGGFSWLPGQSRSDAHTTALVVHGLKLAQDNGLAVVPDMLEKAVKWLEAYQAGELQKLDNATHEKKPFKSQADNLDAFVYLSLAENNKFNKAMCDYLFRDRLKLSHYALAQIGLAFHLQKEVEKRDTVIGNLAQFQIIDPENQTAYLDLPQNRHWWYWYGSEIETMATYLRLMVAIDAKGDVARGLVKYLLNNRKHATYWNSTRDTALSLEAIAAYIKATGEDKADMTVTIAIDGEQRKQVRITPDNIFTFDNVLSLHGVDVKSGKHTITVTREGSGPLYFNAYLTTFSLEDTIKKAGLEIKVERRYYKLVPEDYAIATDGARGQIISQKVAKLKRVPLKDGDPVVSGEQVEVELIIDSKNDYEHIVFEDFKPAGFEAVQLTSGYTWANGLGAYMQMRDNLVSFQVHRLYRGQYTLTYKLRAEVPGHFSALPTQGNGIYAPELRANSDEIKLRVEEKAK